MPCYRNRRLGFCFPFFFAIFVFGLFNFTSFEKPEFLRKDIHLSIGQSVHRPYTKNSTSKSTCPFLPTSLESLANIPETPASCRRLRDRFHSIFDVAVESNAYDFPASMKDRLRRWLGKAASLDDIRQQNLTRARNRWTSDEIIFSSLRSKRPGIDASDNSQRRIFEAVLKNSSEACDLCRFSESTGFDPANGRLENELAASFGNAFPFSGRQLVVMPKGVHDARNITMDHANAMASLFHIWFQRSPTRHSHHVILLDFLNPAGASQPHFHVHAVTQETAPGKMHALHRATKDYYEATGRRLLEDMLELHQELGLCKSVDGAVFCAHLTPVKNWEIMVFIDPREDEHDPVRGTTTAIVMRAIVRITRFFHGMDRYAFSGAVYYPSRSADAASSSSVVDSAPGVVFGRFVPRAALGAKYSDVGTMELFVRSIVDVDPFRAAAEMKRRLR